MNTTYLDPTAGDYITGIDPSSGGLMGAIYLRIKTPLGSWWADKTLGSRLHELQRAKDLPRVDAQIKEFAEAALQSMLADGRLQSLVVAVQQLHDGRALLQVEALAAAGQKVVFKQFIQVA